jgi:hypothetical protein
MAPDADLSGMSYTEALDYIRHFAVTIQKYEKDIARRREELALWQKRAGLAASQAQAGLGQAAREKAAGLEGEIARLGAEQAALRADLTLMKPRLAMLKSSGTPAVDADRLAAEFELLLAGSAPAAGTTKKFDELAADEALAELKKKLGLPG